jgi:nitrous oxidase accessory protein
MRTLFLLILLLLPTAQGAVLTVTPADDLQVILDAASPGDILLVQNGTYTGNFMVTKSLNLTGVGAPVLDGGNTGNQDTITLTGGNTTLQGFVITNSYRAGINCSSDGNVIRENLVIHNDRIGIYLSRSSQNQIENNTVKDTHGVSTGQGYGAYLFHSIGNHLENNTFLENHKAGISLYQSPETRIVGNNLSSNANHGLYLYSSSGTVIEENNLSSNGGIPGTGYGIQAANSHTLVIRNNTLLDNRFFGCYFSNASNSLIQDTVVRGSPTGMYLTLSSNVTLVNNTIASTSSGLEISSCQQLTVYQNAFFENTRHAQLDTSTIRWNSSTRVPYTFQGQLHENFTGNSWDTWTGPDGNTDGIVDLPFTLSTSHQDPYPLAVPWMFLLPDLTPPRPVTELSNITYLPSSITWTWTDPLDPDLSHLEMFLDSTFFINLTPDTQTYTAQNLTPATPYTLGILPVDLAGNAALTLTVHTASTAPLPDPDPALTPDPTFTPDPTTAVPTASPTPDPAPISTSRRRSTSSSRYIPPPTSPAPVPTLEPLVVPPTTPVPTDTPLQPPPKQPSSSGTGAGTLERLPQTFPGPMVLGLLMMGFLAVWLLKRE